MSANILFDHQLDYVLFIQGLAFALLGSASLYLRRSDERPMPWFWLGAYGFLQGAAGLIGVVTLTVRDGQTVAIFLLTLLQVAATAASLEFTRRSMQLLLGRAPRRWMPALALLPAALGLSHGTGGLYPISTYFLKLVSGAAVSAVLWGYRSAYHQGSRPLLAAVLSLMALVLLSGGDLCATLFHSTDRPHGYAAQNIGGILPPLVSTVLILIAATGLWCHYQDRRRCTATADGTCARERWRLRPVVLGILLAGWVTAGIIGHQTVHKMKADLLARVRLVAAALDAGQVMKLTGTEADLDSPAYLELKERLQTLQQAVRDCRFIYLLARRGGEVIFLADSEPADSPDCSPAGQVYDEVSDGVRAIFDTPSPQVHGPYDDRWGRWVSGFEPLYAGDDRRLLAVVCMDIDARDWSPQVYAARLPVLATTLLAVLLLAAASVMERRAEEVAGRIALSEETYRSLVEGSPNCVLMADDQGRCLTMNRNGLSKLGLTENQVIGRAFVELWPDAARPELRRAVEHVLAGKADSVEAEYRRPDGRTVIWHVFLTPVRTTEGAVSRFVGNCIDITDLRRQEMIQSQRLRRLEHQQQAVSRLITDRRLSECEIPEAARRINELAAEAMEVARVGVWLLAEDGRSLRCLDQYDRGDGSHQGGATIATAAFPGYFRALESGRAIAADDALTDLRTRELAATYLLPQGITSMLDASIRTGGTVVGVVCFEHVGPPRHWHDDEISFAGMVADQVAQAMITRERRRAEEELARHHQQLEQLVAERTEQLMTAERQMLHNEKLASVGRLAAGVAHEINTPIQYVGDNLRALAEFQEDIRAVVEKYRELLALVEAYAPAGEAVRRVREEEQRRDLDFILEDAPRAIAQGIEGVDRVARIVRAMKDFTHIRSGELSTADINQCLRSTLTVARNEYKYVADVETDFGELPPVECYVSELDQVFLNILVNAAHAIADTARRGRITVRTRVRDGGVEVSISDTGTGIPEDIRDKIYEPFFTTKEVGRGTGQGLYLAHQIVVGKHGGRLRCESRVGEGTTFHIWLPPRPPQACGEEGMVDPATAEVQV